MNLNKKGIAFEWIYALIFLFFMGLLFIIFNEVLVDDILPVSENLIPNDFDGKSEIVEQNNKFLQYWLMIPIISFVVVAVYLVIKGIGSGRGVEE